MISEYACTNCGRHCKRDELTVKRVSFLEMGSGAKTLRSRVADWLCPKCLLQDSDYNREPFKVPVKRRG